MKLQTMNINVTDKHIENASHPTVVIARAFNEATGIECRVGHDVTMLYENEHDRLSDIYSYTKSIGHSRNLWKLITDWERKRITHITPMILQLKSQRRMFRPLHGGMYGCHVYGILEIIGEQYSDSGGA